MPITDPTIEDVPTSVLSAEHCHLGEGSTYDPTSDTAWWFDILERRLFECRIETKETRVHTLPRMASALARIDAGRQLIFCDDGLYVREIASGRMELFSPVEADNAVTRCNDARVHLSGTFWLGTMGRNAEAGAGAIYALHRGQLRALYRNITIPNAICFSPAGDIGYFADTRKLVLNRVPLDPATGLPTGDPTPIVEGEHGMDGAVVDAGGLIWNARFGLGRIDVRDGSGRRLRSLHVPAKQSTCPAFVGRDLSRVLVTTAWEHMDEAARAADPEHGRTFVLDAQVRGRPEPDVRLG
jgi:sugar lactone lactonase YvrE